MKHSIIGQKDRPSLHSRERGLKSHPCCKQHRSFLVAPLAGAWIEILSGNSSRYSSPVAPLAGAWIEIPSAAPPPRPLASLHSRERGLKSLPSLPFVPSLPSLPSRERGLKYEQFRKGAAACFVAPLAGAWIEIERLSVTWQRNTRRSPRGSVD